jgi:hypothetical protein
MAVGASPGRPPSNSPPISASGLDAEANENAWWSDVSAQADALAPLSERAAEAPRQARPARRGRFEAGSIPVSFPQAPTAF